MSASGNLTLNRRIALDASVASALPAFAKNDAFGVRGSFPVSRFAIVVSPHRGARRRRREQTTRVKVTPLNQGVADTIGCGGSYQMQSPARTFVRAGLVAEI